jgi:hypothetical protein
MRGVRRQLESIKMPEAQNVQTQWWLMDCSFPSLNWARLRVYAKGNADVLDMDGLLLKFHTQEDARNNLLEDEYISIELLTDEDYTKLGLRREQLIPPNSQSDTELVPIMCVTRG